MNSSTKYNEIARAEIEKGRCLVISERSKGGYTIAQQLKVVDGNDRPLNVFLRGAVHIEDLSGLYNLRDALNVAIKEIEKN